MEKNTPELVSLQTSCYECLEIGIQRRWSMKGSRVHSAVAERMNRDRADLVRDSGRMTKKEDRWRLSPKATKREAR